MATRTSFRSPAGGIASKSRSYLQRWKNFLALMGQSSSAPLPEAELDELEAQSGLSKGQIQRLYKRFNQLDRKKRGFLEREDLNEIEELRQNPLGDRIVEAFFTESVDHANPNFRVYNSFDDHRINFRQFVRVLARFRPLTEEELATKDARMDKLRFAFSMYDVAKNNYITKEEFKYVLDKMVGKSITAEQLESIAERTIQEADMNCDGQISFEEFCKALERADMEHKMSIRFMA